MGTLILQGAGLTETPSVVSAQSEENFRFGTVGKPIPGTEVRIASDGEILIRGPHVFKEYYRDPAATREAIDQERWFHSGDIGAIDADGFLRITDRAPVALAKDPRVIAMMSARVEEMNRSLASFEQIKKFVLLGTDFSQETGELTPTLKVKRKVVIQKYGSLLDALYEKD